MKQRNSICGSDLRGAIFSKKVGQGLQRCCRRNEQPPLPSGGLLTSSLAARVEVRKADLTSSHDSCCSCYCGATEGESHISKTEARVWVCLGSWPQSSSRDENPFRKHLKRGRRLIVLYTSYVPAAVLCSICFISFNPCKYLCKVGIIIPILQMWKPSQRN